MPKNTPFTITSKFSVNDTVYIVSYISTNVRRRIVKDIIMYRGKMHYVVTNPSDGRDELLSPDKVFTFDDAKAVLVQYCQDELAKAQSLVEST